jgi:hypothetical protein
MGKPSVIMNLLVMISLTHSQTPKNKLSWISFERFICVPSETTMFYEYEIIFTHTMKPIKEQTCLEGKYAFNQGKSRSAVEHKLLGLETWGLLLHSYCIQYLQYLI